MRVLFLTLIDFNSFKEQNLYCDLLRQFKNNDHEVFCISPSEKRNGIKTHFEEDGHLLKLRIGNTQKTNVVEKGISTLMLETQFISAIKKYFSDTKFDLVLYSTPPITLVGAVKYVKNRDGARTYLMLKDIFPQNAVDLGMMSSRGLKGVLYKYFRKKEKKLYALSDYIGCMSQANVDYLIRHNPQINPDRVEICPNCIEVQDMRLNDSERVQLRLKYGIPLEKTVFVYGGNLGKPQGISFLIDCLKTQLQNDQVFFLLVGNGTEFGKLQAFFDSENPQNMKLVKQLPKKDYDRMIAACDVGMIFLDYRFTIPNFPSRLLSYMQAGLPVLACTDINSDVGEVIVNGKFGWWCESNNFENFVNILQMIPYHDLCNIGKHSYEYLIEHYSAEKIYKVFAKFDLDNK